MKKASRNIFYIIIAVVFFLGLAPRIFFLDNIREAVTGQISKNLESIADIEKMHWVWLPIPHLTLVNATITNARYDLALPRVKIYPGWRIILGETRSLEKIILDRPVIHVHKTAFLQEGTSVFIPPEITIVIKNGTMRVEPSDEYKDVLFSNSLEFNSIRGKVRLLPQEAEVDIQAASPFSEKISLQGNFSFPEKQYRFFLDCRDVKLHKSVKTLFKGRLIPSESTAQIAGTITGRKLQHIEGDLQGTLPCFIVKPQDRETPITCGFADLKFIKSGTLMRLDINNLEIKDPEIKLSGHIERKLFTGVKEEQYQEPHPFWTLDITGNDLDLTAIRQKILTLWHDNSVASTITGIVLGGRARSAAYRFSGRAEDFSNLNAMVIEADVLNADIHVPEADLDLTGARGPIRIANSILSGHGLSAQLGNSFGYNAELLLGLAGHDDTFKLDIDIDADLKDLPPVLARLVEHAGFLRELAKFTGVSGKASGTLHLGESLQQVITRVDVKNMQLATVYEPVPAKIFIDSGTLKVEPERVTWQEVKGRIGIQKVTGTSGMVSWNNGEPLLYIEKMQAQMEGASLFAMLQQKKILEQKISSVLSSLNGSINITEGSLTGPALKPESWQYTFASSASGLSFTSPLLPEPAKIVKLSAVVNNDEANIQESMIRFLDQDFSLKALLEHHLLEDWKGSIEFNGPVLKKLADWISTKGWFPEKLRPQIPCTMKNMQIRWLGEMIAVKGTILHGVDGGRLPMAGIDFENSPEHLHINELTFYAPGEQGRLKLDIWRISPLSLALSWEGYVNASTIDTLFRHSSFTSGNFTGAFTFKYFADRPEATRFEGLLQAGNLFLKTSSRDHPIYIKNLDIKGLDRQLRIPALELDIGPEKITGSGQLLAEKEGLQLDISLGSSFVSKKSLEKLSQAAQETLGVFLDDDSDLAPGLQIARGWDIAGRIGFDFDSFELLRTANTPYHEPQPVMTTFYDMHGDLQLAADNLSRTEIFSAKLCGLTFSGFWFSDDRLGQEYNLGTDPNETMYLENVLPCLGVQQDIIEGKFTLQAKLLKEADTWYDGNIYIKSTQGRILRLKTLSRIFKVVNITDLFENNIGNAGGKGFSFSQMDIDTHIQANNLIVDRAIIQGEGLNLFTRGEIHLDDYDADLTLLIAPFKTFDNIVSLIPIIGEPVLGESGSRMSIPVAVKGPIADPAITPMHPGAIGDTLFNLAKDTFMLPYNILKPLEKSGKRKSGDEIDK